MHDVLEDEVARLGEEIKNKQSEIDSLQSKNTEQATANETLAASLKDVEQKYGVVVEALTVARTEEADRINASRKEVLAALGNLGEEQITYWADQHIAKIGENGEIIDDKEAFEKCVSNLPRSVGKSADVEPGAMVIASAGAQVVTKKTDADVKRPFRKSMK